MTDINIYRNRIGLFSPKQKRNKFLSKSDYYSKLYRNDDQFGKSALSILQFIFKLVLFIGHLHQPTETDGQCISVRPECYTSAGQCRVSTTVRWGLEGHMWAGSWSAVRGSGWDFSVGDPSPTTTTRL